MKQTNSIRDIRKFPKLRLLALSFSKTQAEKNGGGSKEKTREQIKTHVELLGHEFPSIRSTAVTERRKGAGYAQCSPWVAPG
jgi:hypothetical protein